MKEESYIRLYEIKDVGSNYSDEYNSTNIKNMKEIEDKTLDVIKLRETYDSVTCPKCGYEEIKNDHCDKCGWELEVIDSEINLHIEKKRKTYGEADCTCGTHFIKYSPTQVRCGKSCWKKYFKKERKDGLSNM